MEVRAGRGYEPAGRGAGVQPANDDVVEHKAAWGVRVDYDFASPATLEGRAWLDGGPLALAQVEWKSGQGRGEAFSDPVGAYRFEAVPVGEWGRRPGAPGGG